jgi:8-oxo-dGTP diphosphatase
MVLRDGAIKNTVLTFVVDRASSRLLMIHKKRGQGAGKINVPGGKVSPHESDEEAAIRECVEETGIRPYSLREAGRLEFFFPENENWDNRCVVFTAEKFDGELVPDSDECEAYWERIDTLPLEKMWDADRLWLPHLLAGRYFHRAYVFDRHDHVKEERDLSVRGTV